MKKEYYLIDCRRKNLGRLATRAAVILQGKHKPGYLPHIDTGDFVVMINCQEARFSGKKEEDKLYHRFSGYPGGISTRKLGDYLKLNPERVVREAVYGMLPKNKLRDQMIKKLLIFKDSEHDIKADFKEVE